MANIVITGASSGIGFQTALRLARDDESHRILAIARRKEKLLELCQIAKDLPGEIISFAADITDANMDEALLQKVGQELQHLDVLINNAGVLIHKAFVECTQEEWQFVLTTNLLAPARLIRLFLPLMSQKKSHIINVASMGAFQGSAKFPGLALYSASKGALAILSECLAEEFKDLQIRVNCLAPGAVQTDMLDNAFPGYKAPLTAKAFAEFLADFALRGHEFCNGKILPLSLSTP